MVYNVIGRTCLCNDFEIAHTIANRQAQLMAVNYAPKLTTLLLSFGSFFNQVVVLCKKNTPQLCRPIQ